MTEWTPDNWIKLVEVIFWGVAIVCVPLATFFTMIGAYRAKRSEDASLANAASILAVSTDVARLEKNTNSISERNQAIALKLGITEGIAQERASVLANASSVPGPGTSPLPVADDRTAAASERSAAATERVADAAEDASEKKAV